MRVLLTYDHLYYELTPVNKIAARKQKKATGDESVIFQTDWDYPGLAESLGWSVTRAHKRGCSDTGSTDGTVTCKGCGRTASHFIAAAAEWLDKRLDSVIQSTAAESYFPEVYQ